MNSEISCDSFSDNNEPKKFCTRKVCPYKGTPLPLNCFCKDTSKRDGLSCWCKYCRKETSDAWAAKHLDQHRSYNKKYRDANKEKVRARIDQWNKDNVERRRKNGRELKRRTAEKIKRQEKEKLIANPEKHWVRRALTRCKDRAKKRGLLFSLTRESLLPLPEFCSVFGIKLDYFGGPDRRVHASVDRIVPSLGYVPSNIRIISKAANMAKLDGIGDIVILPKKLP